MTPAGLRVSALGCCLLALVCSAPRSDAAESGSGQLSRKESFMLMFGKGNGAMRVLCALERDRVITPEQRRRYADELLEAIVQAGDSEEDRRNARIGMAFADGRSGVCAKPVLPR
jgi:hypothetical protein